MSETEDFFTFSLANGRRPAEGRDRDEPELQSLIENEETGLDMSAHSSPSRSPFSIGGHGNGRTSSIEEYPETFSSGSGQRPDDTGAIQSVEEGLDSTFTNSGLSSSVGRERQRKLKREPSFPHGTMYDTETEENIKCIATSVIFLAVVAFFLVAAFFWNPEM